MRDKHRILGILTVVFWLSFLLYLPPLTLTPELRELVASAREARTFAPEVDKPQEVLEAELLRSLRVQAAIQVSLVLVGVGSGLLLVARRPAGRILALTLCAAMLIWHGLTLARSYPHIVDRLHGIFFLLLPSRPFYVIHSEIVATVFYVATLLLLWRSRLPNHSVEPTRALSGASGSP